MFSEKKNDLRIFHLVSKYYKIPNKPNVNVIFIFVKVTFTKVLTLK